LEEVVTKQAEIVVLAVAAVVATLALSIIAVWLTGDPRAAGPVVMVVAFAVSGVIGYTEHNAKKRHAAADAEQAATRMTLTKAA
jgi:hypothetical protein